MRPTSFPMIVAVCSLAVACGPRVIVDGEAAYGAPGGAGGGASDGSGAGANGGTGAGNGAGAGGIGGAGAASSGTGAGAGKPGPTHWAEAFGEDGQHHLRGLASDAAGNVFLTGDFNGTLDFGGGPLALAGLRASYVAKLDASGKPVWETTITASDCASAAIAVDAAGGVFVTGYVEGSLAVDGTLSASGDGIFVVALDAGGKLSWARTYGNSTGMEPDKGLAVAVAQAGNVIVSGGFQGSLDFGGGPLAGALGSVFALELDPTGQHVWSRRFDGDAAFLAADTAGHTVLATNGVGNAMAAIALDATGAPAWTRTFSAGSFRAVTLDATGDPIFTGLATSVDFGGGTLSDPLPNGEAFVVKLDPLGNHVWSLGLPFDAYQSVGTALTVTTGGHVAVTGSYVHHLSPSSVIQSSFVVELAASGAQVKSQLLGPIDGVTAGVSQEGWGLAPAKADGVYVAGDFYGTIDVAGKTLHGGGSSDIFVARLAP